ncbi:MAG TPA: rhomboid-like protein [Jatrophihabitantaceae bacterium]
MAVVSASGAAGGVMVASPVRTGAGPAWRSGRPYRALRVLFGTASAAPATTAVVGGLVLTVALISGGVIDADRVQRWASTNLVNLYHHPISAMVVSAFVLTGPSIAGIAVAAVVCGLLERRVGARRMLAVAAAGQVIPSLITEGAVRLAIHAGGESRAAAVRFDVGISYVTFSVAAALTRFAPPRLRRLLLAAGVAITVAQFAAEHDMTSSGHALAYVVGLLCWPLLERRGQSSPIRGRARRWACYSLAAMTVIGLLTVYLPVAAFGLPTSVQPVVTGTGWSGPVP